MATLDLQGDLPHGLTFERRHLYGECKVVTVAAFEREVGTGPGEAELSGRVSVGDVLVSIDNEPVGGDLQRVRDLFGSRCDQCKKALLVFEHLHPESDVYPLHDTGDTSEPENQTSVASTTEAPKTWWRSDCADSWKLETSLLEGESVFATLEFAALLVPCVRINSSSPARFQRFPGRVFITSYRLVFHPTNYIRRDIHLPLLSIQRLEGYGTCHIILSTKNVRTVHLEFRAAPEAEGFVRLLKALCFGDDIRNAFAYSSFASDSREETSVRLAVTEATIPPGQPKDEAASTRVAVPVVSPCQSTSNSPTLAASQSENGGTGKMLHRRCPQNEWAFLRYDPEAEFARMGVYSLPGLRVMRQSLHYDLCSTYPRLFLVPTAVDDAAVRESCAFRSRGRLPIVAWIHPRTRSVLARCAQPLAGLRNLRSDADERLVLELMNAGHAYCTRRGAVALQTRMVTGKTNVPSKICNKAKHQAPHHEGSSWGAGVWSSFNSWAGLTNESKPEGLTDEISARDKRNSSPNASSTDGLETRQCRLEVTEHQANEEPNVAPNRCSPKPHISSNTHQASTTLPIANPASGMVSPVVEPKFRCHGDDVVLSSCAEGQPAGVEVSERAETSALTQRTPFYIIDARSQVSAFGNRALGKGTENPAYYPGSRILFMGIENIHSVRGSFTRLAALARPGGLTADDDNFDRSLADTGWMRHVRSVICSSVRMARCLEKGFSVLTHCSDGWDRCPQMVALAELLLDPHFRTMRGFAILVEKEWCAYGHQFRRRCGHACETPDDSFSPIFILWIDCVWQTVQQYPSAFEFGEEFLIATADSLFSGRFGNFLCNSEKERAELEIELNTPNLWAHLCTVRRRDLLNPSYRVVTEALWPNSHPKCLQLWKRYYFRFDPLVFPEEPKQPVQ